MTKKNLCKEVFIENKKETRKIFSIDTIGDIRKHLGYETIVVFSRFFIHPSRFGDIEYCVHFYKKNAEADIDLTLKELNKHKRTRFWEATNIIKLNPAGFNLIFNEATTHELKLAKMYILSHLGDKNYANVLRYINRKIYCEKPLKK